MEVEETNPSILVNNWAGAIFFGTQNSLGFRLFDKIFGSSKISILKPHTIIWIFLIDIKATFRLKKKKKKKKKKKISHLINWKNYFKSKEF